VRCALVTGGAKGIGRGVALDLAARGWGVALAFRRDEDAAAATVEELRRAGAPRALAVRADVGDAAACDELFARVAAELGAPDALVHAAGPYHRVDVLSETPAGWREMLASNLDSLFYCARLAAPTMIARRWGRVLAFSIANADQAAANPGVAAHYVAKVGVLVLARTLAKALAPSGVTVNCISPGFIDSGSTPADELARMVRHIPAGALGRVADCVAVARFLLSDEAAYVNGANVVVSGGWGL